MGKKTKNLNLSNITQKWVELLIPFTGDYSEKFSASEMSKKAKIPQQTASRILNQLSALNMLKYASQGKNKLFYLDLEKQTSSILLGMIEQHKALKFQLMNKDAAVIVNDILRCCESIIIFGSYASGTQKKESDIDMVIFGKANKKKIKEIKLRQTIEINEHYATYDEFNKILKSKNPLSIEIMNNHIIFGDTSNIINIFKENSR